MSMKSIVAVIVIEALMLLVNDACHAATAAPLLIYLRPINVEWTKIFEVE